MKKESAKTVGGWAGNANAFVPQVKRSGQGSRTSGVGMEPLEPGAPKKSGYQTNYSGLPGHGKAK